MGISRSPQTNWVFDAERGGDTVGARLPGLSLAQSSAEWNVEGPSRLGYGEWTFVFQNEHANPQEARAQIKLPPGACVSRLTLWVNGEPQEAALRHPTGQGSLQAGSNRGAAIRCSSPKWARIPS